MKLAQKRAIARRFGKGETVERLALLRIPCRYQLCTDLAFCDHSDYERNIGLRRVESAIRWAFTHPEKRPRWKPETAPRRK